MASTHSDVPDITANDPGFAEGLRRLAVVRSERRQRTGTISELRDQIIGLQEQLEGEQFDDARLAVEEARLRADQEAMFAVMLDRWMHPAVPEDGVVASEDGTIASEPAEHIDLDEDDQTQPAAPAGASSDADDTSATLQADDGEIVHESESEAEEASSALRRSTRGAKPTNPYARDGWPKENDNANNRSHHRKTPAKGKTRQRNARETPDQDFDVPDETEGDLGEAASDGADNETPTGTKRTRSDRSPGPAEYGSSKRRSPTDIRAAKAAADAHMAETSDAKSPQLEELVQDIVAEQFLTAEAGKKVKKEPGDSSPHDEMDGKSLASPKPTPSIAQPQHRPAKPGNHVRGHGISSSAREGTFTPSTPVIPGQKKMAIQAECGGLTPRKLAGIKSAGPGRGKGGAGQPSDPSGKTGGRD